jgi:YVTN family beta-propeller protein
MLSPANLCRSAVLCAAFWALPASAAPFAYVANADSDDVSVIDIATNAVVATVPVGDEPYGVGITPDNRYVYVANHLSNSLSVIDAKTNTVTATVANVCANPAFVEPTPDGTEMWVSCLGETRVVVVNRATHTVTRWLVFQTQPHGITFNADGSRVYVASFGNATVRVHRADVLWELKQVPSGIAPTDVQIEPSGVFAWVLSSGESRITNINLATNRTDRTQWFSAPPFSLTIHPDGARIYVTLPSAGLVSRFNPSTFGQSTINVGGTPMGIDRNADGSRLYVANENGYVTVLDTATNAIVATIPVGSKPRSHGRFVAKGFLPPDSVPEVPSNVVATAGVAQVSVAFSAGGDGGGPILRYTATCGTQSQTGMASPIVVSNLAIGTPVTCTVVATNALGDGAASAPSNAATPYAIVPAAPAGVVATAGDYAIAVAFATPYDGHSAITQYTATCATPDIASPFTAVGPTSPITVIGTPNAHSYTCTVFATNAIGDGAASAPSAAAMPDAAPPRPTIQTPVRGNGQLTVAFAPVAAPNGYSAITSWTLTCGSRQVSGASSPLVVTGLTNGVPQTCTVVARNARGDSPPSEPSAAVAPATVPDAPEIVGVARGNGMVTVSFVPPAYNGGMPVTGYIVRCGTQAVFGGNLSLPVSGLANGVPVTCTVLARNDVGDGAPSAPSESVTPATVPDAPALTSVASGDGSAQLAFAAPAQDGGADVSGYRASCAPGAHAANGTASPLVVEGLTNGQTYTCSVVATNEIGTGVASAGLAVVPRRVADLSVAIDNGTSFIAGGATTTYLIDVANGAAAGVAGVRVRTAFGPGFVDLAWACSAQAGSQCPASGSGELDALVDMAGQSGVTFLVTATVAAQPEAPVSGTATIAAPNSVDDPVASNDTATDGPDAVGIFADGFE